MTEWAGINYSSISKVRAKRENQLSNWWRKLPELEIPPFAEAVMIQKWRKPGSLQIPATTKAASLVMQLLDKKVVSGQSGAGWASWFAKEFNYPPKLFRLSFVFTILFLWGFLPSVFSSGKGDICKECLCFLCLGALFCEWWRKAMSRHMFHQHHICSAQSHTLWSP